ncbi:MAG: 5'-3' exonuclease H3TH domain-containing protein [Terrimicrobiaceae bacterium]
MEVAAFMVIFHLVRHQATVNLVLHKPAKSYLFLVKNLPPKRNFVKENMETGRRLRILGTMRVLLVDGHYYLYRSFFAIRELTNSRGEPTNAIFGFAKALRKMLTDLQPDFAAVIWDCGLPERRTTLQPEYKQNRTAMPDEMRPQETWLQTHVPLFGPASLFLENTEADDLIASYAREAERQGIEAVIATNDKDILQLATPGISIYSTAKADLGAESFALLGPREVTDKWGVEPAQIGDVLALTGDSSDNIAGVEGVGQKTAAKLIRAHGSISALLAELDSVQPEKLRDKLRAATDKILANREMVSLDENLPLPVPLKQLPVSPCYDELIPALRNCEFRSLLRDVEAEASRPPASSQGDIFSNH